MAMLELILEIGVLWERKTVLQLQSRQRDVCENLMECRLPFDICLGTIFYGCVFVASLCLVILVY